MTTSVERYDDQSRRSFIREVAERQRHMINCHNSMYKASWSKMVRLRKDRGKFEYFIIKQYANLWHQQVGESVIFTNVSKSSNRN